MKIRIAKAALLPALAACNEVADQRSAQPAAACVVLTAAGDTLQARATNYRQTIARTVDSTTVKPGVVMVNAKDILQRIDRLDDGEIAIEATEKQLIIKQAGSRYTLPIYDAATAPTVAHVEPQGDEVGAAALAAILDRAAPAMCTSEAQANIYGVALKSEGGKLWAKAINGKMAALVPMTFDGKISVIVPAAAVSHLHKALSHVEGSASIAVVGSSLHVFADGFAYSTLLTGDEFPPIEQTIPRREGPSLTANRKSLLSALKLVTVGCESSVRVRLRPCPEGVAFMAEAKDGSPARKVVEGHCDMLSVCVASDYLSKLLEFGTSDAITLWQKPGERVVGQTGMAGPMVTEEDGAIYVSMPLAYDHHDLAPDAPEWS